MPDYVRQDKIGLFTGSSVVAFNANMPAGLMDWVPGGCGRLFAMRPRGTPKCRFSFCGINATESGPVQNRSDSANLALGRRVKRYPGEKLKGMLKN